MKAYILINVQAGKVREVVSGVDGVANEIASAASGESHDTVAKHCDSLNLDLRTRR